MSKEHRRFHVDCDLNGIDEITLDGQTAKKIRNVLRLSTGETISLFNGSIEKEGQISAISSTSINIIFPKDGQIFKAESFPLRIAIGLSIMKNIRMETAIEKATELGVEVIQLIVTERSISRQISESRMKRFKLIATQSAEQSGRISLPEIHEPIEFKKALTVQPFHNIKTESLKKGMLNEKGGTPISRWAGDNIDSCFYILVGPEGGFTDSEEVSAIEHNGFEAVHLTGTRLRSETALISAVSYLMLRKP